ncbi:MAG: transcriptional regulator [Candidatus Aenigmatarchaeota archaeon]|nr:MAG: transcriptional regulator [Candidatus Aenigmarchaeota archaeon]RLJ07400.1 MAG: transcriptional regulator [Candidatus Aenigmarchaeota archaeon]
MTEYAVPFHWRRFKERYLLIGSKCEKCKRYFYPGRAICPVCRRSGSLKDYRFSGKGKVFSYTIIHVPPKGFEAYAPYIIAIIELEEGCKVISQVVDCKPEDIKIGMPVRACFRKIREEDKSGLVLYGFKFRPD